MGWYTSYTAGFKFKAIAHALENGNHTSGRHSAIDEVCSHYWRWQHEKLKAISKICRAYCQLKTGHYLQVEITTLEHVRRLESDGCAVSIETIQNETR